MLPAPASIAAAPSPKSRASWNPAVPPPPVAGAAAGNGLADRLGDAEGRGEAEGPGEADRVGEAAGREDVEGLVLGFGVVALAVPLGRLVGVAEPVAPGENVVGVAEGDDPEQADASMVKAAQPTVVSLALNPVPAMIARTFMGSPHASGRVAGPFPGPASETGIGRADPLAARVGRRQVPESAEGHKGKAHTRHRHAMSCSPLKYQATRAEAPGEDGGRDHSIGGTWSGGAVISGVMVTAWENWDTLRTPPITAAATTGLPRRLRGLADAGTDEPGPDRRQRERGRRRRSARGAARSARWSGPSGHALSPKPVEVSQRWMLTSRTPGSYHAGESRTP
jgi:hypothetical protein